MTIAEFAKERAVTPQAIYKRLRKLGVNLETIRNNDKSLTPQGFDLLSQEFKISTTVENRCKPLTTVENLQTQLQDMRHRAEMAEARAAAAENERDFLRTQLDNALKANALASMKRLEEPKQGFFNQLKTMFKRVTD